MSSNTEDLRDWAQSMGWRWDESCKWFAIDLHEDGGGPLTTVLNEKAMRLFHSHMQTAFDDVIGKDLVDYGGQGEEYKSYVNDEKDEQRRRAAKRLGGDK